LNINTAHTGFSGKSITWSALPAFLSSRHGIPRGVETQRMTHEPVVRLKPIDVLHLLCV
jgi:hypothetical protein